MVDEIRLHTGLFNVLYAHIARQLLDDGRYHLKMTKLLRADVGQQTAQLRIRHRISLTQITKRGAELSIRTSVLTDDEFCQGRIRVLDSDRILQALFIDKHPCLLPFLPIGPGPRILNPVK